MKKNLSDTDVFLRASRADDPHWEIKAQLAQFLLALIQAFLRTGYYTSDHPEAQKAKMGLYEDFQGLFSQRDELTFLIREEARGKNILIEGVLPEIQDLNSLMIEGMAEMYVPRFVKFLEQKDLVSLTLKNAMTPTEFTNFVDVMSEPSFVETRNKGDKEKFNRTLREKGIVNISYIYNEELVTARNIPWRAQIALTRLKKDFSMVPYFTDLDLEGLRKVRRQIIQDLIRPLRNAEAIYYILTNTDLAVTEEFKETEIDQEIIECLSDDLLALVSRALLTETFRRGEKEPAQGKPVELAKDLAHTLNLRKVKGRESILQEYVKHKLISADQLPAEMQRQIRLEQLTNKMLQDSNSIIAQLDKIKDEEKYLRVARTLGAIMPELTRRDHYEPIFEVISCFHRHLSENKEICSCAAQILDEICKGETILALKSKFLLGRRETCQAIAPIFEKLGSRALPQLVSILVRSQDHLVRKNACELIMQVDPSAINFILSKLNEKGSETRSIIDILRILAELDSDGAKHPLANGVLPFLNHENPHIRAEALRVYYRIKGPEGKALYFDFLNDNDVNVQKEAIECLARVGSSSAFGKFMEMLKNIDDIPSDRRVQIEACLCRSMGFYGNIERPEIGTLEAFLLKKIDSIVGSGTLRWTTIRKKAIQPEVIAAICETLGKIGTSKSRGVLQKLKKHKDSPWQNKAEEALAKIAERAAGSRG
jgi:HEAT repeat protein